MIQTRPEQIPSETEAMDGVAIIGMAGRFPGAPDLAAFWQNLLDGRDTLTRFGESSSDYVAARGVLEEAALFDAEHFGISPREADLMDPQHRVFLEACSNALEDAGYVSSEYPGEIALFAGCSLNTYLLANLATDRAKLDELTAGYQVGEFQTLLGNDKDFLTTRVAYKLNLRGPVVSVQSACATSLVAVCQAAQSLLNFQCDLALAGGVSITFPQQRGHRFDEGGIVSRDGHCRPFDAEASGTVFGHGVGVVLLKRLEEAVRDGDHIAAVIRGFAVNNDGSAKAGYMAPGVDGQARVIAAAQAMAGIGPDEISYIEAHGTGTPLGDPIEIAALTRVFREATQRRGFCVVGTAKGNVGHLDAAAGVTGLIKTALSMQHHTLPALNHFHAPNANIDLSDSPFTFNPEARPWQSEQPLRAGVSAFGVGGVNVHVVLEEAPAQPGCASFRPTAVLCVSGRSEAAANQAALNLAAHLEQHPDIHLADAAYTLGVGRKAYEWRIAVAAATPAAAAQQLREARSARISAPRIAFQFSGQATHFVGMGRDLYEAEPIYRAVIDEASETLAPLLGRDLRGLLFAAPEDAVAAATLERTEFAQPAIFATELALAELWKSWGIEPSAMVGHSLGEYAAATIAQVFARGDALRLIARRGQLMQALEPGAMLAAPLAEAVAEQYVTENVSMAAINAPASIVFSGPVADIQALVARLTRDGIKSRPLSTSHAFHSAMMEPMLAAFEAEVAASRPQPPTVSFVSTVTGTWITSEQATSSAYWAQQCRQPVRFAAALQTLLRSGFNTLLEIGPGNTLTSLAARQSDARAFASLTRQQPIPSTLGELWASGAKVSWRAVYANERRRRISLPTYPFERKLHWIEPPAAQPSTSTSNQTSVSAARSTPAPRPAAPMARSQSLQQQIAHTLTELSGIDIAANEYELQFLELGFDSLFLTQATQALSKKFGLKLTFRQLMEQFSSIAALADHLDATLPADVFEPAAPAAAQTSAPASKSSVEQLLSNQIDTLAKLFADQLAALRFAAGQPVALASSIPPAPAVAEHSEVRFASHRNTQSKATQEVTPRQQAWIDALIAGYEARTPNSKRLTQQGRAQLADPRAVAGFRPQWKEMVYPLLVDRARGSRLWDVDGNEYIDIVNGYGCILFGHSPDFVVKAATEQLERGVAIGPQTPLAAEVAALLCELTGNERVTFCNTGSEAVMAALRVARTVTGRDLIVYFTGDYHGTFDEVLIRNTPRGSAPVAPGIPLANVTNVVVLDYGAPASLDYIRANGEQIAAVLIEPVQTRHPENKPFDFIREIRTITEQTGSVMILDEVVTGFRLAPGGVQQFLGIRADMCTYGKVIGGGHPIGVLSGKAACLDALDGGTWQYGDASGPEVGVTFFAGTFVRHPLAMAAARAVLRHLKQAGPALQQELNARTGALAESLDRFFVERGVPSRIHHFCSWFYFTFPGDARLGSLLYYRLRAKGIHIQEGYPCFLTTAHTDADLAAIERAFRETIEEMQAANILPSVVAAEPAAAPSPQHAFALAASPSEVPLTEPQREVFLAAALNDQANCAFNESLTLDLRGPVRKDDLAAALVTVLNRHDALRSTVSEDGETLRIAPTFSAVPEFLDLRQLPPQQQQEALAAAAQQQASQPFSLTDGPLIRAHLYELADDHLALMLTAHHIVLDGWSANQLLEEVGRLYSHGASAELQPLLPFSSYALRERDRKQQGEYTANEVYWVQKFERRSPRLDLPTDRPRPLEKSYVGRTLEGRLGSELYTLLKQSSARTGSSLYVTLLSGFQLLLHRLTGQDEVVVGISTAGQALIEDASLVGHAVHFLPMVSDLAATTTAGEHLRATKTALLDAYDHQEFTFGSLLRKLRLDREPGRLPLIEVQFNLERVGANVAFNGLRSSLRANPKHFVNTDLFLNVIETANDLEFMLDFNTELFEESTVARWMQNWAELLKSQAANAETPAAALNLLTASERELLLESTNRTGYDFGRFSPVTEVFLARAAAAPEAIALECNGIAWTNHRLRDYASSLAQHLHHEGLAPGDLVGIAVERSPEMLGAVLAVMLAGGAYVPLDPRHPHERLQMVLDDAGAKFLLTARDLQLKTSARLIHLAAQRPVPEPGWNPAPLTPTSFAYVIFTSGSTGRPKGVAIEHAALHNLLRSMQREPGLSSDDTLVAITTLAFDIAGLELLLPLLTGARLVIATDPEVLDGHQLLALLERSAAATTGSTVLQATPGAWRILLDAGWSSTLALKALCGGEALPRELADKLLERASEVWNMYGPTETTIWSSATRVQRGSGTLRLGQPIRNTQFYVLDPQRNPAPTGVTGELFIGGHGLARGYWNKPELTAEKFLQNPFHPGRIYSTGDLARRHADGSIELLGRSDFQVKIRGYRIELPEIEAAILQHPAIQQAVVIQKDSRLVAYLATSAPNPAEVTASLPTLLAATLPDYMVPSAFVVLPELPRTANGKLDRKALPDPSALLASSVRGFVPPSTPAQQQLAAIYREILQLPQVSITDSIFELGAESLLIFRIAARAQRDGLPITPTVIFQQRTIEKICATLNQPSPAAPLRRPTRITAAARASYRIQPERVDA